MRIGFGLITFALLVLSAPVSAGTAFDGAPDNQRDDLGYYYMITGGKFPTGTVPNGDNASGGTFRYILDDPFWGGASLGVWHQDDWFPTNASFAVTLQSGGTTVYDNAGIEDNTYGDYYDASGLASSGSKPGLYRGYSMSNNFDWIYAGYFKLEEETVVDTVIGYFDANAGFNPDSNRIAYDMNIWSSVLPDANQPNTYLPAVASFTGDVFSSRAQSGAFTWSDTGVDRVFGDDYGNMTDDILRLTYVLDTPLTLQPGVYFFSHDAEIVPLPSALWLGFALLGGMAAARRLRRRG